jgi:hypothetical protein
VKTLPDLNTIANSAVPNDLELTPRDGVEKEIFGPFASDAFINYNNIFNNDTSFYSLAPTSMLNYYYRIVRRNLQWFRGFVPGIHNNGIYARNLGNFICKKMANLTMAGDYRIEGYDAAVNFIDMFNKKRKIKQKLAQVLPMLNAVGFALGIVDFRPDGHLNMSFIKGNRYYAATDEDGNIKAFRAFRQYISPSPSRTMNQVSNLQEIGYYLVQERWMEGENVYECFKVYQAPAVLTTVEIPIAQNISEKGLPPRVLMQIKLDTVTKLDKVYQLPLTDHIGAVIIHNEKTATGVEDFTCFSDSTLYGIHSYLYDFDWTYTMKNSDKYFAQTGVLVPDAMDPPKNDTYIDYQPKSQVGGKIFKKIPYLSPDEQEPFFFQANLRAEEYNGDLRAILNDIAAQIGLTPTTLAGFLDENAGARTATEVNSEETATRLTIEGKRKLISDPMRELYEIVLRHYQVVNANMAYGDIDVVFNQEVIANPVTETNLIIQKVAAGLMTKEDAIKQLNKYMSKKEVEEYIKKLEIEEEKKATASVW